MSYKTISDDITERITFYEKLKKVAGDMEESKKIIKVNICGILHDVIYEKDRFQIDDIKFVDGIPENPFGREVSVLVTKNSNKSGIFNLRLNDSLLKRVCSSFKKVKIDTNFNKESIFFDWYLQVGKTKLAFDSYKNLEQFDIIFLDDCSSFQSKRYTIMGLGNVVINGELNGSSFVVNGKCS